jgi:hypothetical protein
MRRFATPPKHVGGHLRDAGDVIEFRAGARPARIEHRRDLARRLSLAVQR